MIFFIIFILISLNHLSFSYHLIRQHNIDPTINLILILRPRSKHTSKIYPLTKWILPITEIKQLYLDLGGDKDKVNFKLDDINDNHQQLIYNEGLLYISCKHSQLHILTKSVQKSILIHGIYSLCSYGKSPEVAIDNFSKLLLKLSLQQQQEEDNDISHTNTDIKNSFYDTSTNIKNSCYDTNTNIKNYCYDSSLLATTSMALGVFEDPWIEQSRIIPILNLLNQTINKSSSRKLLHQLNSDSIISTNLSNKQAYLLTTTRDMKDIDNNHHPSTTTTNNNDNKLLLRIFCDSLNGPSIICQQLSEGLAAPYQSGQGCRYPLPLSQALRRPSSGILNHLALHKMPYKTPTAMEPELALLMANLAGIAHNSNSEVLDPYCGSCMLLAAAAIQGAKRIIGMDANREAMSMEGIYNNFNYLGLITNTTSTPTIATTLVTYNTTTSTTTYTTAINKSIPLVLIHGFAEDLINTNILSGNNLTNQTFTATTNTTNIGSSINYPSSSFQNTPILDFHDYYNKYLNTHTHNNTTATTIKRYYDAIITDPPYGIQEVVRTPSNNHIYPSRRYGRQPITSIPLTTSTTTSDHDHDDDDDIQSSIIINDNCNNNSNTNRLKDQQIVITLLQIADKVLVKGGKLVCFLPYRTTTTTTTTTTTNIGLNIGLNINTNITNTKATTNISTTNISTKYPLPLSHHSNDTNNIEDIPSNNFDNIMEEEYENKIFSDDHEAISQLLDIENKIFSDDHEAISQLLDIENIIPSSSLKIVVAHKQFFSSKLSRYLCVFEKL